MAAPKKIVLDFIGMNKLPVVAALTASLLSNFLNVLLPLSIGKFYDVVLHDIGSVKGRMMKFLPFEIDNHPILGNHTHG